MMHPERCPEDSGELLGAPGVSREGLWRALGSPAEPFLWSISTLCGHFGSSSCNFEESFTPWGGLKRHVVQPFLQDCPGNVQSRSGTSECARKRLFFPIRAGGFNFNGQARFRRRCSLGPKGTPMLRPQQSLELVEIIEKFAWTRV